MMTPASRSSLSARFQGSSTPSSRPSDARITAVLGPTNTGKTYLAIERMLGHASGMIGFPLRLLARENYDRIVRLKGAGACALITGEEKILPANPRYFICTVEAMPLHRQVEFLAIDEIQLAADPDRGHIFTDRLLRARGLSETMFLGAETIRPLIRQLVPGVEFVTRQRFSSLTYAGSKKLTRLPRRSAVVAFSSADVYSIAELIRRQSGGAAVVLGALSPRTRNAQVALYQSGDVDYLVATDAIGMGLNMDIDHVAFAALRKFDGHSPRGLTASEVAQIAGRAGRHMNDGTFGTTGDAGDIDPDIIEQVEEHTFTALKGLFWRNPDLRFTSLETLLGSLGRPSQTPGLVRTRPADDQIALETLVQDEDIRTLARGIDRVRLLWDVCQIPDFRKMTPQNHARLLGQIFRHLGTGARRLPTDWVAGHLGALDRTDGDMHALIDRIAAIRVWSYVSQRSDWMEDARHWQETARRIEDALSDALHDRLTQRFVDVRTSVLSKRLKQGGPLLASVSKGDQVSVEGHAVGVLEGLTFVPEKGESRFADRAVVNAATRALRGEIGRRVTALVQAGDDAFSLSPQGRVLWQGAEVARLAPGPEVLRPDIVLPVDEFLDGPQRDLVKQRLRDWMQEYLARTLSPMLDAPDPALSAPARGLLFQVREGMGVCPARAGQALLKTLTETDRKALTRIGIRFGTERIFVPALLKAAPVRLRATLLAVAAGEEPVVLRDGAVSFAPFDGRDRDFHAALGFPVVGGRAVRADALERLAAAVRERLRTARGDADTAKEAPASPVELDRAALALIAAPAAETAAVITALGYPAESQGSAVLLTGTGGRRSPRHPRGATRRRESRIPASDNPFAVLRDHVQHRPLVEAAPASPSPSRKKPRRRKAGQDAGVANAGVVNSGSVNSGPVNSGVVGGTTSPGQALPGSEKVGRKTARRRRRKPAAAGGVQAGASASIPRERGDFSGSGDQEQ